MPTTRDAKLIQYLNEAYGKEKELELALAAHIGMTTRAPYKKRLREHLKETKGHARELARRIKQLGGKAEAGPLPDAAPEGLADAAAKVQEVASKGLAAAKGPLHAVRGTGENEKMLKNAKTEYFNEFEEIATYTAIETFAEAVGDRDTAKVARTIRRDEERMAKFLERQIGALARGVATEEVPAAERRPQLLERTPPALEPQAQLAGPLLAFRPAARSPSSVAVSIPFHLPASVHYHAERHVWARPDGDDLVTVGVAAPLSEVLWHAPEVEFWAVDRVDVGSPLATAQGRQGRRIAIASPVAGAVVETNELLDVAPHALVSQPYVRGWVARVYPDNWERDCVWLLSGSAGAAQYRDRVERSLARSRPEAFAGVLL